MVVVVVHEWDKTPSVSSMVTHPSPWFGLLCQSAVFRAREWRHTVGTSFQSAESASGWFGSGLGKPMKQFYTASLAIVAVASCVDCEAAVTASTTHS